MSVKEYVLVPRLVYNNLTHKHIKDKELTSTQVQFNIDENDHKSDLVKTDERTDISDVVDDKLDDKNKLDGLKDIQKDTSFTDAHVTNIKSEEIALKKRKLDHKDKVVNWLSY